MVTERFCDYLLGIKFHVYTDSNPLAYVRESKLGALRTQWLSELALFNFSIYYQTGRPNKVADALSRHPHTGDSPTVSAAHTDEVEVISYSSVCELVGSYLDMTKIPDNLKKRHFLSAVQ